MPVSRPATKPPWMKSQALDLRQRALGLLARREYSQSELRTRLARHTDNQDEIESLLQELIHGGLLSDARYAQQLVTARSRKFGAQRIAQELRRQGVDSALSETALAAASLDEAARMREIWRKKFGTLPIDRADYARQARFLQSRGFSHDLIRTLLNGFEEE